MATGLFQELIIKGAMPVIVNGQILRYKDKPLFVDLDRNKIVYFVFKQKYEKEYLDGNEDGEKLIIKALLDFSEKYARFKTEDSDLDIVVRRDDFLRAYVVYINLYLKLADADLHSSRKAYAPDVKPLIETFILDQICNYFEIFYLRISKKLMAKYMPIKTKAHLVSGLYQPLYATTPNIVCPLKWGMFDEVLSNWENKSIILESVPSKRGLELIAISMYDFCSTIGIPLCTELDKRIFMATICAICALSINRNGGTYFFRRFPEISKKINYSAKELSFYANLLSKYKGKYYD